jgi:superfamily I DNA/RNA helicase
MLETTAYLDTLNSEQRRAVEHGVTELDHNSGGPLLVIAGAGSGKTNTLAHRVAHLIVNGADPRRILLMTFSRRAAAEMTKRVERISRKAMGDNAGVMTDALTWTSRDVRYVLPITEIIRLLRFNQWSVAQRYLAPISCAETNADFRALSKWRRQ